MSTTVIDHCDIAAYRFWTDRRAAPAYVRGIPSWVWQCALSRCRQRRRAATT